MFWMGLAQIAGINCLVVHLSSSPSLLGREGFKMILIIMLLLWNENHAFHMIRERVRDIGCFLRANTTPPNTKLAQLCLLLPLANSYACACVT